jgi:hypothetical protein
MPTVPLRLPCCSILQTSEAIALVFRTFIWGFGIDKMHVIAFE